MAIMLIVKGAGSRGKTSSLKNLIKYLLDGKKAFKQSQHPNGDDTLVITERNGRKIGIITLGDPGYTDYVRESVENCHKEKVDFIVAASRTYGEIYDTLLSFAKRNGFTAIETGTFVLISETRDIDKEDALNKLCAQNILNIIDSANEIEKKLI